MLKAINIGHLDRRVTIQSKADAKDAYGLPTETWSDLYTNVPAKRDYGSSKETEEDGQNTPEQEVRYLIKYASSINTLCRVIEDSKIYEVEGIEEIGRRQGLLLHCKYYGNSVS